MVCQAKDLYKKGEFTESLNLLKKAYEIQPTEKIQIKIERLEQFIKSENKVLLTEENQISVSFNNCQFLIW